MEFNEKDVIKLCKAVQDLELIFWDNPNGGYEYTCPICNETKIIGGQDDTPRIDKNFPHSADCEYYIAKDLLTNMENK